MRNVNAMRWLSLGAVALFVVACAKDPSKDAPAAKVQEAKPAAKPAVEKVAEPAADPHAGHGHEGHDHHAHAAAAGNLAGDIIFVGSKVTGTHACKFTDWSGSFTDGETLEAGTLSVNVKTTSMACDYEAPTEWTVKLEKHLRSEDFFASEKFPEATFVSTGLKAEANAETKTTHTVTGNMTIRGTQKEISFPATLTKTDAGFQAAIEFTLNRKDFGIEYPGKPDDLIREGVVLKLKLASK